MKLVNSRAAATMAHVVEEEFDGFPGTTESDLPHECAICLDPLPTNARLCSKNFGCPHIFHPKCLKAWLKLSPTCPVCRHFSPSSFKVRVGTDRPHTLLEIQKDRITLQSTVTATKATILFKNIKYFTPRSTCLTLDHCVSWDKANQARRVGKIELHSKQAAGMFEMLVHAIRDARSRDSWASGR
eukprot:m.412200 g.412200  ORF g.412200 m.412200 type:complete len:185 (-) comp28804_c0_seq1:284-838(-)